MATIACIQNGIVVNVIIGEVEYALTLNCIDDAIDITNIVPMPQIGYTYSAGVFSPPQ